MFNKKIIKKVYLRPTPKNIKLHVLECKTNKPKKFIIGKFSQKYQLKCSKINGQLKYSPQSILPELFISIIFSNAI